MSLRGYLLFIVLFIGVISVSGQGLSELDNIDDPKEKIEFLNEKGAPLIRKKQDSSRYYYAKALDISRKNNLELEEAKMLRSIANTFYYQRKYDTCMTLNQMAIEISEKINDLAGISTAYRKIGTIQYLRNDFVLAVNSLQKSVSAAEKIQDSAKICAGYNLIGASYYSNGVYPKALSAYQNALQIAEKSNNLKYQARMLNNIGGIQDVLKNYPLALSYWQQAIDIKNVIGDTTGAMSTRENMATLYSKMGEYDRALLQYDTVLAFKQEKGDEAGLPTTYMNIGYANEKLGKFNSALEFYSKSLKLLYQNDDNANIAVCLNNIGDIYYALGKYKQAIDSSQKSLSIGRKMESKSKVKSSALSLTKSYVEQNNYRQAYNYHLLYAEMKDSLFNEESAKVLQEMETKYQTAKKQQEIEKQNLTIEKQDAQAKTQRIINFALWGGIILVLLIAIQVFRGYKQKKKANALLSSKNIEIEEKNANLNEANIEISSQKEEIEEKNLNIMDSIRYAKRIQQTILPRDQFVEKQLPKSFVLYKPKDIVSGDFYWIEEVGSRIYASAVDCTGHGVPGAFVSIVGYNSMNRTVMEFKLKKPGEILNKLNDLVVDTFVRHSDSDVKDGMDMSLLCIDRDTDEIEFAGAQNPLYVVNDDGIIEIKGNKHPIGSSLESKTFDNHKVETKENDMIYLFSDGYIDQFGGPKGKKFMRKRFKDLLSSIHKMDVKTQKLHLDNTIKDWMSEGGEEQLDDILVIGIRV